ncbi:MAG: GNAT family N-acetyltransferase [Deltaproteobacteria bacterium]|nr:GNAT family N-acetyltransferase [Deltaproteobacteria bacterium]MBW2480839.1 GNAT family N-acetyltransferase [Deltaproteobacteria bacterium]
MDKVQIRHLQTKDAEAISRIYAAITMKPVDPDFKRVVEEHAQRKDQACFVAEQDGKVVGFMISYILTAGFGMPKSAWIATLGVDPNYMGQSIGASLAEEILNHYRAQGVENVYTSVRWDSSDLLSFFKTLGFDRSNFINLRKVLK